MYLDRKRLSVWLFSALILFGQSVAFVHQSGHDIQSVDEYCVQCLTQSVFDGKAAAHVHTFANLLSVGAVLPSTENIYHSLHTYTAPARAPPISPA